MFQILFHLKAAARWMLAANSLAQKSHLWSEAN